MGLEEDSINDLDTFLDTDELADTAYYNGETFAVQFYNEHEASLLQEDQEVETANPYFETKASNVTGIVHGERVTVGEAPTESSYQSDSGGIFISDEGGVFDESGQADYRVIGIEPDGLGWIRIILEKE